MYNPLIEMLVTDIQHQIVKQQDEEIYKAVLHYIPNVDKEELLRALQYDRNQYEKGYTDGKADAMAELVRCENCKHWFKGNSEHTYGWCCQRSDLAHVSYKDRTEPEDFCSKGERRNNEV